MANVQKTSEETILTMFPPGESLGTLTKGVFNAVAKSYEEQNMKNPTRDETKRRFNICMKWVKILRGDLKWGVQRIADEMPHVLRTELLGGSYAPPKREIWVPGDGA